MGARYTDEAYRFCSVSIDVQNMARDAAVNGDVTLLKRAMLYHALGGAAGDPEEV